MTLSTGLRGRYTGYNMLSDEDIKSIEDGIDWSTFPANKINDLVALRYKDKLNPTYLISNSHVSVDVLIKVLKWHLKHNSKFYGKWRFKLSEFSNYGAVDLEKIMDSGVCSISEDDTDIGKLAISDSIVEKYHEKLPNLAYMVNDYTRKNLSYSSICKLTRFVNDRVNYVLFDSIKNDHSLLLELFDKIWVNSLVKIETDNIELRSKIDEYKSRMGDSIEVIDKLFSMIVHRRADEYNRYGNNFFGVYNLKAEDVHGCKLPLYVIKHLIHWSGKAEFLHRHIAHVDVTGIDGYDFEPSVGLLKGGRGDDKLMEPDVFNDTMQRIIMQIHYNNDAPLFDPEMVRKYPDICEEVCAEWFKDMSVDTLLENWSLFNHARFDEYSYSAEFACIYVNVHSGEGIDHRILDRLFDDDDAMGKDSKWYNGWNYQYCMTTEDLRSYRSRVNWKQILRYRDITDLEMSEFVGEIRNVFSSDERWKIGHDLRKPNFFESNCKKFDDLGIKIKKVELSLSIPAGMSERDAKDYLYNLYKDKAKQC